MTEWLTFRQTYPFDSVKTEYQRKCLERNTAVKYPKVEWFNRKSYRGKLLTIIGIQMVCANVWVLSPQALGLQWHALALQTLSFFLPLNSSRRKLTSYRIRCCSIQWTRFTITSFMYILIFCAFSLHIGGDWGLVPLFPRRSCVEGDDTTIPKRIHQLIEMQTHKAIFSHNKLTVFDRLDVQLKILPRYDASSPASPHIMNETNQREIKV